MKAEDNIAIKALKERLSHLAVTSTPAEPEAGGQPFKIHQQGYFLTGLKAFSYRQKPQDKPVLSRLLCTLHNFETNSTCTEQIGTKFQTGQEEGCGKFEIDYTKNNVTQLQLIYDQAGLVEIFISTAQNENARLIACKPTGKLRETTYIINGYLFAIRGEIKKGGKGFSSIRFSVKSIPKFDPEELSDEFIKAPIHKTDLIAPNKGKGQAFDNTRQGHYIATIQGIASPHVDRKMLDICGLYVYLKSPYDVQKKSSLIGESLKHVSGLEQVYKQSISLDYSKTFVNYVRLGYDSKSLASIQIFTSDGKCHKFEHSGQKIIRFQEYVINGILIGFFGMNKPGIQSMGLKYKKINEIK